MATKQILNFYNVAKNALLNNNLADNELINIQRTYLSGYDLYLYLYGSNLYTYQYYEESLEEIKTAMKENLEIVKPKMIKEFNFSVNEPYQVPVIGKNYYSVKRNETMPNFKDKNASYVDSWANERGISVIKNYTESNSCVNDSVIDQNIHSGTLVNNITSLTINVCKNIHTEDIKEDEKQIEENKEENEIDEPIENMVN